MQNGSIESSDTGVEGPGCRGSVRDECLDLHMCRSLDEARRFIERWPVGDNETGPHTDYAT